MWLRCMCSKPLVCINVDQSQLFRYTCCTARIMTLRRYETRLLLTDRFIPVPTSSFVCEVDIALSHFCQDFEKDVMGGNTNLARSLLVYNGGRTIVAAVTDYLKWHSSAMLDKQAQDGSRSAYVRVVFLKVILRFPIYAFGSQSLVWSRRCC